MITYQVSMPVWMLRFFRCFLIFLSTPIFVVFRRRVECPIPQECAGLRPTLSCIVPDLGGFFRVSSRKT